VPSSLDRSRYLVARTRRPYALFHDTRNFPVVPQRLERVWLEVDGERVPVQLGVLEGGGEAHVLGTLYAYDGEPITHLLPRQIAAAGAQLRDGTRPLTLFRFDSFETYANAARGEELARRWLADAWRTYAATCRP
jgi:hypothetical protein